MTAVGESRERKKMMMETKMKGIGTRDEGSFVIGELHASCSSLRERHRERERLKVEEGGEA